MSTTLTDYQNIINEWQRKYTQVDGERASAVQRVAALEQALAQMRQDLIVARRQDSDADMAPAYLLDTQLISFTLELINDIDAMLRKEA